MLCHQAPPAGASEQTDSGSPSITASAAERLGDVAGRAQVAVGDQVDIAAAGLVEVVRANPDDRDRYASLKEQVRDLDGDAYTRAKTALIQELVDRARSERGLPTVPVWEE